MMEQMEFENLIDKLKKRKEEGDIKNAIKVADKIPWDEVEDVNLLMFAASIYDEGEHYKDAKLILEYAYEIAPVKNRLNFALCLINAKCKELKDAISYYTDFCDNFPDDNRKLLLQYYIMKAKDATLDQQKRLLSEYLSEEKDEKMTFELALICDKLGEKEEVIEYCDFIIRFFGVKRNGYGKNALLLKKKYVELSDEEKKLLEDAEYKITSDDDTTMEFKERKNIYNMTKLEDDKVNIRVEKVQRPESEEKHIIKDMANDNDELLENQVKNNISISYTPDEESYKESNNMAFMRGSDTDKEKLRRMIKELKEEEMLANSEFNKFRQKSFIRKGRLKDMKLNETKLHMIIEAHSKDEGVEIAQKELSYIHDVLGEKTSIAKASAYNMNDKGFSYYEDKIKNKDLIIENGGQLSNEVIDEIEEYIINKRGKTIFALVDLINNFDKLATDRPSFVGRFDIYSVLSSRPQETLDVTKEEVDEFKKTQRTDEKDEKKDDKSHIRDVRTDRTPIPKERPREDVNLKNDKKNIDMDTRMSIDDFVEECKKYAKSIDCSMDGETVAALYDKAEEMENSKIPLTKENAAAFIEEAADRAEKPKLFSKPKYDKDGCLILLEEHFDF